MAGTIPEKLMAWHIHMSAILARLCFSRFFRHAHIRMEGWLTNQPILHCPKCGSQQPMRDSASKPTFHSSSRSIPMLLYTFTVWRTALLSLPSIFKPMTLKRLFSASNVIFPRKRQYVQEKSGQTGAHGLAHWVGWYCLVTQFGNEGNLINSVNKVFERQMSWLPISYHP